MKMKFDKIMLFLLAVVAHLFLCGSTFASGVVDGLVRLPTGEIVSAATNRFGAWERVEVQRTGERAEFWKFKAAEAKAKGEKVQPQIIIDSAAEMESYERLRMVELMAETTQALKEAVVAMATGNKSEYAGVFVSTPFPKGAFAEFTDSLLGGATDLVSSPAGTAVGIGKGAATFVKELGSGKTTINSNGGDVSYRNNDVRIGKGNSGVTVHSSCGDNCGTEAEEDSEEPEEAVE